MFIKYEAEVSSRVGGGERGVVDFGKQTAFQRHVWQDVTRGLSTIVSVNTGSVDRAPVSTARLHGLQFGQP